MLAVSTLLNTSPWGFFTGLGAATAVIMLVFKDSILGFIASVQLAFYDMVRIGDWIEMQSFGADGDVIEISLSTVKVRNFDKTIVTIPTYAFLTQGVKNWRGMEDSGGRRIKRSLYIDMNTIKFCDQAQLDKFRDVQCLIPYIEGKLQENVSTAPDQAHNDRNFTNIGMFRAYTLEYLRKQERIHSKGFTFMVRLLEPTDKGVPMQVYAFTRTTKWVEFEAIQSDIFDHLLAILPFFELRAYQSFSGRLEKDSELKS